MYFKLDTRIIMLIKRMPDAGQECLPRLRSLLKQPGQFQLIADQNGTVEICLRKESLLTGIVEVSSRDSFASVSVSKK